MLCVQRPVLTLSARYMRDLSTTKGGAAGVMNIVGNDEFIENMHKLLKSLIAGVHSPALLAPL